MARGRGAGQMGSWAPLRNGAAGVKDKTLAPTDEFLAILDAVITDTPSDFERLQPKLPSLPMSNEDIRQYSHNAVMYGAGVQEGDHLVIHTKIDAAAMAVSSALTAYENGAETVSIITDDTEGYKELLQDMGLIDSIDIEDVNDEDKWNLAVLRDAPFMQIGTAPMRTNDTAPQAYFKGRDNESLRWSVVQWPTLDDAVSVYPELLPKDALKKYADDLIYFSRSDTPNGMQEHLERLRRRADTLNSLELEEITIDDGTGNVLSFGMLDNTSFSACNWNTTKGKEFSCNIPTEEVFCTPDPAKTSGTFKTIRPISLLGADINEISGKFENGSLQREGLTVIMAGKPGHLTHDQVTDMVYDALKEDAGLLRVGELALVGNDSRIAERNRIYNNYIIDENFGCHIGMGESFLAGLKDHREDPARNKAGGHFDLTISSAKTKITAKTKSGRKATLMENGVWRGPLA